MIRLQSVTSALAALLAIACSAHAATLSVGSLMLAPDGSGHVDVRITSSGESINLAGYEFQITPDIGTSSQLRFIEEGEGFLSAADYVFVGNSGAASDGLASSVGLVSTTVLPGDTFTGGDGTIDFADVVIGDNLLVRLNVEHDAGPADPATTLGHAFSIALVPPSGDSTAFTNGGSNTGLVDANFSPVGYESSTGSVSIVVPEPGSLTFVLLSGLCILRRARTR